MRLFILTVLVSLNFISDGQIPDWDWARRAGGTYFDYAKTMCIDNDGHVYIAGGFNCCFAVFGNDTVWSNGSYDIYIAKYDTSGNFLSVISAGGPGEEMIIDMCYGNDGYLYATGYFKSDTITFGNNTFYNYGSVNSDDLFLAKYDTAGNVIWAKAASGNYYDRCYGMSLDNNSNIYITGYYDSDTISFGNIYLARNGNSSAFTVKYDSSGNTVWAKRESSGSSVNGFGVATDLSGNVYMTGAVLNNSIWIGTNLIQDNCTFSSCSDYFLVKYDSSGNILWAKGIGGAGNGSVFGYALTTDSKNNILVTGSFYSSYIIAGNDTINNISNSYDGDVFIFKYDSTGNFLWASRVASPGHDAAYEIKTDSNDDIYVTGVAADIYIKANNDSFPGNYYSGGFIAKFASDGADLWAKPIYGIGEGLCLDQNKKVYVTGDFRPAQAIFGNDTLVNWDNHYFDIFIARLDSSTTGPITSVYTNDLQSTASVFYPNPMGSSATIRINLKLKNAQLNIYDLYGRRIKTINNISGSEIQMNSEHLTTGSYLYQIISNAEIISYGKILVVE